MNLFHYEMSDANFYEIEEVNFQLPLHTRNKITTKLEKLLHESPARSFANLVLKKDKSGYLGQLKIESLTRTFFVEAKGHTVEKTFLKLEEKLKVQLKHWRMTRFLDAATDVMPIKPSPPSPS